MPVQGILNVFDGITTGLLLLGGGAVTLTLAAAGLCTMFAWMDMHIGGFVKRVFSSVMLGGSMVGGAGAFGKWLVGQLGMTAAPAGARGAVDLHSTLASLVVLLGPLGLG